MSYNPNSQYPGSQYSGSQYSNYPSDHQPSYNPRKKPRKKGGCFGFILIVGIIISAVFVLGDVVDGAVSEGNTDIAGVVQNYVIPAEECYHYSQLNEYGQHIYRELLAQAPSGTADFTVSNVTRSDFNDNYLSTVKAAVHAFSLDHPEFFWLGNGYSADHNPISDTMVLAIYQYDFWKESTQKGKMVNELFSTVDEIVANANRLGSDYDKIKYIHDYIVDNTVYDHEVVKDLESPNSNRWYRSNPYHQTAYGSLVKGKCVCAGYADAFQLLSQQLGFECMSISGETPPLKGETEPGRHAWNMIKLGGDYYYFDPTWDDTDSAIDDYGNVYNPDRTIYNYFGVTTAEFSKNHTDLYFDYPLCTATRYNFHQAEGYTIDWYSENMIENAIKDQFYEGYWEITLKFSDKQTMDKTSKYLYGNFNRIKNSCGYYGDHWRYHDDELMLIYFRPQTEW